MADQGVAVLADDLVEVALGGEEGQLVGLAVEVEAVDAVVLDPGVGQERALDPLDGGPGDGVVPLGLADLEDDLLLQRRQLGLGLRDVQPGPAGCSPGSG